MTALFSRVLEAPFPSKRMVFPFPAPVQWRPNITVALSEDF